MKKNPLAAGTYEVLSFSQLSKRVMTSRDKKFWGNLVYLQSVVKHKYSVGESIPYHFYAPLNEKETLEKSN